MSISVCVSDMLCPSVVYNTIPFCLLISRCAYLIIHQGNSGYNFAKTDTDVLKMIAYILIVAGALTFIVSFLGYCGAMFESRCLLCVYGVLILVVLILECVAVGLAFGLKSDAERGTKDFLKTTITYYASNSEKVEAVTVAWDGIMSQMHCCGVDGYEDFGNYSKWSVTGQMIPEACCKRNNGVLVDSSCSSSPNSSNSYYQQGCYKILVKAIEENAAIVIGVAVVLVFVELLVIILALYLACCYWRPQHGRLGIKVDLKS
ncbi:hypothetical protein PV327_000629 [Microctonus hyperodae]|uniref:Tetraspanin n=1 Tax=Microctonus hyperodae TaxID=165561 RepID=A0AA39G6Z6_MICHY|nr:hypothetical protein PV327_000629 [Microctonus hyperodae]